MNDFFSLGGANDGGPIYEDIDQYHHHPPMIAPVSGVPNLKVPNVTNSKKFALMIHFNFHSLHISLHSSICICNLSLSNLSVLLSIVYSCLAFLVIPYFLINVFLSFFLYSFSNFSVFLSIVCSWFAFLFIPSFFTL